MANAVKKLRDEIIREKSLEYVELYNKCVDDKECNESEIACMRMVIAEEIATIIAGQLFRFDSDTNHYVIGD